MSATATTTTSKEAVMGQVIPRQHPAVALKSHYKLVRALLAAALVAIVALAATVVILANDDDQVSVGTSTAQPIESINYGGFNPATGVPQKELPPGTRFDGGPDEGTRGIQLATPAPGTRFDGGPDEGTRGPQATPEQASPLRSYEAPAGTQSKEPAGGPRFTPMGPSH
jgi:hypothetical protein